MSQQYYVKYKGGLQGPFSIAQLQHGVDLGKLTYSHPVSTDRNTWISLGQALGIAPEQPVPAAPPAVPAPPQPSWQAPMPQPMAPLPVPRQLLDPVAALAMAANKFKRNLMAAGIVIAVAILTPLAIISYGSDTVVIWIWSGWSAYPGSLQLLIIWALLASAAFITVSVALRGLARSITVLGIATVSCLLLLVGLEGDEELGMFMIAALVIPCVLLMASCNWRMLGPTIPRRVLTCILGGILSLVCMFWLIGFLSEFDFNNMGEGMEATLEISMLLCMLAGLGFGIAAGVLGILQVKSSARDKGARLCIIFSRLCPICFFGGILVIASLYGIIASTDEFSLQVISSILLLLIRMLIAPLALLVAIYCGTYELMLVCSAYASRRPPKPVAAPLPVAPVQPPAQVYQPPVQPYPQQPVAAPPPPPPAQPYPQQPAPPPPPFPQQPAPPPPPFPQQPPPPGS